MGKASVLIPPKRSNYKYKKIFMFVSGTVITVHSVMKTGKTHEKHTQQQHVISTLPPSIGMNVMQCHRQELDPF